MEGQIIDSFKCLILTWPLLAIVQITENLETYTK